MFRAKVKIFHSRYSSTGSIYPMGQISNHCIRVNFANRFCVLFHTKPRVFWFVSLNHIFSGHVVSQNPTLIKIRWILHVNFTLISRDCVKCVSLNNFNTWIKKSMRHTNIKLEFNCHIHSYFLIEMGFYKTIWPENLWLSHTSQNTRGFVKQGP
jgi:hypothetical protein